MKQRLIGALLALCVGIGALGLTACNKSTAASDIKFELINDAYAVIGFRDEEHIREISIPSTYRGKPVVCLYKNAFMDCKRLQKLTIPASITKSEASFSDCESLEEVHIESLDAWLRLDFESEASNPLSVGADLYLNNEKFTTLIIPSDITEIKPYTFFNCDTLDNIIFGNAVESIGAKAFERCDNLQSVTFENVKSIGDSAFFYCANLQSVSFENVESIDQFAFYHCDNLQSAASENVKSIGDSAFFYCDNLQSVAFGNVESIGDSAFYHCVNLQSVAFENVESIGRRAFAGCEKMQSVTFENVKSIGDSAFYHCDNLQSAAFENVESIDQFAFSGCKKMQSILLGKSLKTIGSAAFSFSHDTLRSVFYGGTEREWAALEKQANLADRYTTVYFYSADRPAEAGNYWHYANDGSTPECW